MNVIADDRYGERPKQVDCTLCYGFGRECLDQIRQKKACSFCLGTGLEPMPWTELFTLGYDAKWKK